MQFRSYTYDLTEIDVQYALDSRGNEIREILLDEAFTGENLVGKHTRGWMDGALEGIWGALMKEEKSLMMQNTIFK